MIYLESDGLPEGEIWGLGEFGAPRRQQAFLSHTNRMSRKRVIEARHRGVSTPPHVKTECWETIHPSLSHLCILCVQAFALNYFPKAVCIAKALGDMDNAWLGQKADLSPDQDNNNNISLRSKDGAGLLPLFIRLGVFKLRILQL